MILLTVKIKTKPGINNEQVLDWMRRNLKDTRSFKGNLGVVIGKSIDEDGIFVINDSWETTEDMKAYQEFRDNQKEDRLQDLVEFVDKPTISIKEKI